MTIYENYLDTMPTQAGRMLQRLRIRKEWMRIQRHQNNPMYILEIGPGYGGLGTFIDLAEKKYFVLDSNPKISKLNQEFGFNVVIAEVPLIPIKSGTMELIYASHVVEHMPTPNAAFLLIREINRILQPNGLVYLSGPDFIWFGYTFWDIDYTHSFPITKTRLQQLLKDGGFEVLELFYFYGPFTHLLGFFCGLLAKLSFLEHLIPSDVMKTRLRRLRLTFMRNVCILAKKT